MNSAQAIEEILCRAGFSAKHEKAESLLRYLRLLEKWNTRVNLTASTRWEAIGPLLGEAVWAASLYPEQTSHHLDIGSGAGFPAIPMRILRPRMVLHLIEVRNKRAAFLETVAQELALADTAIIHQRLEDYLQTCDQAPAWNAISWKAVKLGPGAVDRLLERSPQEVEFWLFHGRELPLRDAAAWEQVTGLRRREECPHRRGWSVSIFTKKPAQSRAVAYQE